MQGRLSPMVDGRIQAFPWTAWRGEFPLAGQHGFSLMEWTLDEERLHENPLMTADGRGEIFRLSAEHNVRVPSVTGDCFMQAPFWKVRGDARDRLVSEFLAVADACARARVTTLVVPLVDNAQLQTREQEDDLAACLRDHAGAFAGTGLRIAFESDYAARELARLIGRFDAALFGINYDIGNSARLGFNPVEEISAYGDRILNVHVKDRTLGGPTVPLGAGAADFETVFEQLARVDYAGSFILQTARAVDGNHAAALRRYGDMTAEWLARHPIHGHAA